MQFNEFLLKIGSATGHDPKRSADSYTCRCPAHDDRNPSLSVKEDSQGKILIHCHAGCEPEAICAAIGVQMTDLFPDQSRVDDFRGMTDRTEYIYQSAEHESLYKKVREPNKRFYIMSWAPNGSWNKGLKGSERVLYKLPELLQAKKDKRTIFVVEGEKDAERLRIEGQVATTPIEGAGSKLPSGYAEQLAGSHVVILYDEDPAGHQRRDQWTKLLIGKTASLKVIRLPGLEFREKGGLDVSDWLDRGHTMAELLELVNNTLPYAKDASNTKSDLTVLNLDEFLAKDIPQREMILDPIIPTQGLTMLYSKRGVGKTFLSLAVGHAIATGSPLLRWQTPKPRPVLYVDGEMPAAMMQERLALLVNGTNGRLPDPSYFRLITPDFQEEGIPDLATDKGQQLLEDALGDAQLLILDNLSTLAPSIQENEADAWAPFQGWILKMRRRGISVLLVHHAGKGGQQRGTSRREDVLDVVLVLKRSGGYSNVEGAAFQIHLQKARGIYGDAAEPFSVKLETTPTGGLYWSTSEIQQDHYESVVDGIEPLA